LDHSQLSEIQNRVETVVQSKSRLDIRGARRKLALWEELNSRIDNLLAIVTVSWICYESARVHCQHLSCNKEHA
jgi:hypothetical protein